MAESSVNDSRLRLVYEAGIDEEGDVIFKAKSYANLRIEATADQAYQAGQALASLSSYPLYTIERHDKSEIYEG